MVIQTDIYYFMAVSMVSPSIFVVIAKHEAWRTLNQMIKHNEIDKGCGGAQFRHIPQHSRETCTFSTGHSQKRVNVSVCVCVMFLSHQSELQTLYHTTNSMNNISRT